MRAGARNDRVQLGLEVLLSERFELLRGRRCGLLANPTSVTPGLEHAIDALQRLPGTELRRLFAPEHGLRGEAQDMVAVDERRDAASGLPIHSLYGAGVGSLRPPREALEDLEVLIYDVQDIGCRFYTFAATLSYCMDAAATTGTQVLVCDRPNPIDGVAVEGGRLEAGFESFVGALPVPIRHGLTVGELARLHARRANLDIDLQVLPLQGWSRSMTYEHCGIPWVLPSPNMPTVDTARVYPGMCLVEGTNCSEGRGTTRPFELAGAPWLSGQQLERDLRSLHLPGLGVRACSFRPTFQKHAGQSCGGVQLHVTDPQRFRPVLTGVAFLWAARKQAPERFAWRSEEYEFVREHPAIDLLAGSPRLREGIEAGLDPYAIAAHWDEEDSDFRSEREEFLLY